MPRALSGSYRAVQWTPGRSAQALEAEARRIRKAGQGQPYDSVIGLSGGVDSSYTAYLARELGLRPLAIHFDNGWDSELAVENIQRIVEACSFDLQTYVIDWREFRDLQRAFLSASVVDIELVTDHAIFAAIANIARDNRIRVILSGDEPRHRARISLVVGLEQDGIGRTSVPSTRPMGRVPLKSFPHSSTTRTRVRQLVGRGPEVVELLNLVSYRRDEAAATLAREFGWRDYGGQTHKSLFTKFYQGAILPQKFGIDKRRAHLSDLIRNGEFTRGCPRDRGRTCIRTRRKPRRKRIVRKKLGFSEAEWNDDHDGAPRRHDEFATERDSPLRSVGLVM